MSELALLPAPPHIMGPTWRQYEDGSWYLPEHTLGWQVLAWLYEYALTPGGPNAGEPFFPTDEQLRFIAWWYAIDDNGKFIYRDGMFRRMKGHGKDPIAAALSLAELCGPVQFSHWDPNTGQPVGKPKHAAWIQIAAVSQDQTRNTFALFPAMASPQMKSEYGLDINKTLIYAANGGIIEGVTSSPLSLEGKRPTFVIKNETQWWVETNSGHQMDEVIQGNVDKSSYGTCRALAICNAHIPGEDSIAERTHDYFMEVLAGKAIDTGVLYDALEAPADTPLSEIPNPNEDPEGYAAGVEKLKEGLRIAAGDSVWLPIDIIAESMLDRRRPVTESRRKFLNQVNASEDSWIAPWEWDRCHPEGGVPPLEPDDKITLGFDGSKSNDHTALVACRVEDAALFVIKTWDPESYPTGEVPREQVDAYVRSMFERYDVVAFRADVKEFEAYVDAWGHDFKKRIKVNASPANPVAYDMRGNQKKFALDCERFLDAVIEQELCHDGNPILRQHVLNSKRHPTQYDSIAIRKASKDSSRKIDAAVCAVLAFGARHEYLLSKKNRSGRVVVIR